MNFHIRGILTLWLGFTWSGILAVRSAALHTGPAGVVSCHGSGPEPSTWQVSTLSPPADNANKGCVAAGRRRCITSTRKRTFRLAKADLNDKALIHGDNRLFWHSALHMQQALRFLSFLVTQLHPVKSDKYKQQWKEGRYCFFIAWPFRHYYFLTNYSWLSKWILNRLPQSFGVVSAVSWSSPLVEMKSVKLMRASSLVWLSEHAQWPFPL